MWMILSVKINDPLLRAIVRYWDHPNVAAVRKIYNFKSHFFI